MSTQLARQSTEFAARLTKLLSGTVNPGLTFESVGTEHDEQRRVGPTGNMPVSESSPFSFIPLVRLKDPAESPRLLLKAEYKLRMDSEDKHLAVVSSSVGLWVKANSDRKRPSPVVRLEYDRDAKSKPAAHVHLHAESAELAWLYGSAGALLPRTHEIHFPLGGRRFRPTLEHFLLFLDQEGLFTDWASEDWKQVINDSLGEWEGRQVRATVRRQPHDAVAQLRSMGYTVLPPSEGAPGA